MIHQSVVSGVVEGEQAPIGNAYEAKGYLHFRAKARS